MNITELCAKVYFDRLDKHDQERVTPQQCRERGGIYKPVIVSALHHVGVTLDEPETAEDLV